MRKLCDCDDYNKSRPDGDVKKACGSCEQYAPEYASEVPVVPVSWEDRDAVTGRILQILEAVLPDGKQLDAVKDLVKESTKQYWINMFNWQFEELIYPNKNPETDKSNFRIAIWKEAQKSIPKEKAPY